MLQFLSEYNFRELQDQYVYVQKDKGVENATGIVIYVYVDHEKGLCYEELALANFNATSRQLKFVPLVDAVVQGQLATFKDCQSFILPSGLPIYSNYLAQVDAIKQRCVVSENVEQTRRVANLDGCRAWDNPDVVLVHLVHQETIETCYVLLEGIQKMFFYGVLLQEPQNDFGVHLGNIINFYNVKNEQGIMCMSIFA